MGDLKPNRLSAYIESYIEPINMYDFNNFLRAFAKTVIIDYLREHISLQMEYYLYNADYGIHSTLELFCKVYNRLMTEFHKLKFLSVLKHLGKRAACIYSCRNYEALKLYIEVFEYRYLTEYLLRKIKSPMQVYNEIVGYYEFDIVRYGVHRYLIRVNNYVRY